MDYQGEIQRCVDRVEVREQLRLDYDITDTEYRSQHTVTGEVRGLVIPDQELVRSREFPPTNPIQKLIQTGGKSEATFGEGYPGTDLVVAVTRVPPMTARDEQFQDGFSEVAFSVDGLPENGTVVLNADWDVDRARDALSEDERKTVSHEYDVTDLPSDQLPIVIRGHLRRDAREFLASLPSTVHEKGNLEQAHDSLASDLQQVEGWAALSVEVEYRESTSERDVAGGGQLSLKNFRLEMDSTFPNIEFRPTDDSTYNPEQKRVEWRNRTLSPGESTQYIVLGPMEELLNLGHVNATVRGVVQGTTLTGTKITGLYDRAGADLAEQGQITPAHGVVVTGDIRIDPTALRSEDRKVMEATVSLNDTPFDAFDRLQTVCEREGMTIRSSQEPANPEPVANREGVLEISAGEDDDADDIPGEIEIKREYGDEGVVYAHVLVYGRWTSVSRDREVTQSSGTSDGTEDSLVRADQGALGDRGKTTVDVRARSRNADLNSRLVGAIQDGLGGGNR